MFIYSSCIGRIINSSTYKNLVSGRISTPSLFDIARYEVRVSSISDGLALEFKDWKCVLNLAGVRVRIWFAELVDSYSTSSGLKNHDYLFDKLTLGFEVLNANFFQSEGIRNLEPSPS